MKPNPMHGHSVKAAGKSKRGIGGVLKELLSYSRTLFVPMCVALLLAAICAILTIAGPNQLRKITDLIEKGLFGQIDLAAVGKLSILLLAIYLVSQLCIFVEHFIMATITLGLSKELRRDLSAKINHVPMKCFSHYSHGDILSRVTNDVSTLQQALSNSLPPVVTAVTQFIGCLVMMFVTEWRMAFAAMAATLLGFLLMVLIMSKSQEYFTARQENLGRLNGYVEEMYSGHDVVRISRAGCKIEKEFDRLSKSVYEADRKSQFLSGVMQPLMNVVGNLGYVAVCVLGAALVIDGQITFGVITAFILYVRLFTSPLSTIAQCMTQLQSAAAAGDRIFDFLSEEELPDESGKTACLTDVRGAVDFGHVRFSYPDTPDKIIIKDFSVHIDPGQKVAIVGPTGAGKTTLVNLLMRFYDIADGDIRIDGISTSELTRENVHSLFGMVLQDTWMIEGTVRENLCYNKEGVSDETLERACRACGVWHFVETLPDGLDSVLSENTSISAGQKQLFTIARAMVQDHQMLILDEATSSVDTRTELITQKAMDLLTEQRTSFVIAHRLSTIKNADLILVMKDGDIIEQGDHETLIAQGGFYATLYNSQFESVS